MTETTRKEPARAEAWLEAGGRRFPLEADRIHVIGSGDHADIRLVHDSVAPAHATICFHRGQFIVGATEAHELRLGDGSSAHGEHVLPPGERLQVGRIELALHWTAAATGTPTRGRSEASFAELMAHELRRAPWFVLSAMLHAALLLLIWLLQSPRESKPKVILRFEMLEPGDLVDGPELPFQFEADVEPTQAPTPTIEAPLVRMSEPEAETFEDFAAPEPRISAIGGASALFQRVIGESGAGDIFGKQEGNRFSPSFRKTVAGLRASGLEIVFAFDSTGSMGPVLKATKERMARMVRALHALVPDARIGVVTYRDHGKQEKYLTRSVPLDRDLYRSLAFLLTVDADGGGDRPEAVLEALDVAIAQPWSPRARRVVVVIGDAPAHRETEGELARRAQRFCQDGSTFVHTIVTASDLIGQPERDVQRSFQNLARAGRGACVTAERDDTILRQVLSLAVGAEFRDNIDELFTLVEEREGKIATRALDLVRRGDPIEVRRELSRAVVDDDVVDALARCGRRQIADLLVQILQDGELPPRGMHAASWALQSLLGLPDPLVDPERPERIERELARKLGELATALK